MFGLGQDLDTDTKTTASEAGSAGSRSHKYDDTTEQHQIEAAAVLSHYSNGDIIAWIKLVRSARIEPITNQRPGQAHLSPAQIHALFALKDCPDDRILTCLELARRRRLCKSLT